MRKGFTLIEVMVVLSILAIIAILGYNFFGSTMKGASTTKLATQIFKDSATLSAAWQEYYRTYGEYPSAADMNNDDQVKADIMATDILKSWPEPPAEAYDGSGNWFYELRTKGAGSPAFAGTTQKHPTVLIFNMRRDVCERLNELYTSQPGAWDLAGEGVTWPTGEVGVCNMLSGDYRWIYVVEAW